MSEGLCPQSHETHRTAETKRQCHDLQPLGGKIDVYDVYELTSCGSARLLCGGKPYCPTVCAVEQKRRKRQLKGKTCIVSLLGSFSKDGVPVWPQSAV